jgi:hypothetical protein
MLSNGTVDEEEEESDEEDEEEEDTTDAAHSHRGERCRTSIALLLQQAPKLDSR